MLLAAVLRNFKCYKNINYISFYKETEQNLNVIIGDNGVGKSTILEGLDTFFNDAKWIINSEAKDNASVGAVFFIEKNKIDRILEDNEQQVLSIISDSFWDISISENANYNKYQMFFQTRDAICSRKDTHYLLLIGKEYNKKEPTNKNFGFLSFDSSIKDRVKSSDIKFDSQSINTLLSKVVHSYSYLYIPVETTVSEFLKLEAAGMQTLVDKNIKDSITEALSTKTITRHKDKGKSCKLSVMDIVNEKLENYIKDIQTEIQKIDSSYDFNPGYRQNVKLTPNQIANEIIDTFYAKRPLKKDKKPIQELSSGEKRQALIDIIHVFLSRNDIDKNLILAIDEPESSLHISKCYGQFRKIQDVALKYEQQLFITTHWYGSLPILKSGNLLHIEHNQNVSLFDLTNYFEDRGEHPNDINLKSFFDLSSSIISAFRHSDCNWILVEGSEDKKYLEYYLPSDIKAQIIPLCGCGNVKKIYEYLYTPMQPKSKEIPDNKSPKILCLVDTDKLNTQLNVSSETKNQQLIIRRWYENENHDIDLLTIDNPNVNPTEIEEILNPYLFYNALKNTIERTGLLEEKDAFNAFEFDTSVKTSRIIGDYSIINHLGGGRNIRQDKETIVSFINNHKKEIADEYIKLPNEYPNPSWVEKIIEILETK